MLKEFKEFAMRGNVIDMAIGVIIGGAFGRMVNSLVEDIIMPPIALLIGRINFTNLFINLTGSRRVTLAEAKSAGHITINYGKFLNEIVDFLIITLIVYIIIIQLNRFRKNTHDHLSNIKTKFCPYCSKSISFTAIRCPYCTSRLTK